MTATRHERVDERRVGEQEPSPPSKSAGLQHGVGQHSLTVFETLLGPARNLTHGRLGLEMSRVEHNYFRLDVLWALITSALRLFAVHRAGRPPKRRRHNVSAIVPWVAIAIALIGLASVSIEIYGMTLLNVLAPITGIHWTYVKTGRGEQLRTPLNDSKSDYGDESTAQLNPESEILVESTATDRHITVLKGHVDFQVAPDEQRPFVVTAPNLDVRAVGTRFGVRLNDDARTDVGVFEGVVQVETRPREVGTAAALRHFLRGRPPAWTHSVRLERDKVLSVTPQGKILPEESTPGIEEMRQLSEFRIAFKDAPIWQIVGEFNRYLPYQQLRMVDEELGKCRMTIYPPMKATEVGLFVKALEVSAGAEVSVGKNGRWVVGRTATATGTDDLCPP